MRILLTLHQMLAFALELAMLAVLGYYGYQRPKNPAARYALAILLPMMAIVLWGYFAAPRSEHRLPLLSRLCFEGALFLLSALLLHRTRHEQLAFTFALLAIISLLTAYFTETPAGG